MVIRCSSYRIPSPDSPGLSGRQRRRLYEWEEIEKHFKDDPCLTVAVNRCDHAGVPVSYMVTFQLRSICGVGEDGSPVFTDRFEMEVTIPERYPQADAPARFRFVGEKIPWHPNITYFGEMAGVVCLNQASTFTDLAWGMERVAAYLRYDLYHAEHVPPYPSDLRVARWVRTMGEPMGWIYFDQND